MPGVELTEHQQKHGVSGSVIPATGLFSFLFASLVLCVAPGPDNLFVLTQAALYGRKAGLMVTLGLCTGLLVHTTAVALGMAALFQASPWAFMLLKTSGAVYLLFLAWQAFHASLVNVNTTSTPVLSKLALYRRGIIMNITNPKVSIFFIAFLPQFASPAYGSMIPQLFTLGAVFVLATCLVFSGIAIAAGALGGWLTQSPRRQKYLNRAGGFVLVVLGVSLLIA